MIFPDRFENIEKIGSGTFGEVFKAFDREKSCEVALKTVKMPTSSIAREFHLLKRNQSPYIAEAYELFPSRDFTFYSMEFIDGKPFDHSFKNPRNLIAKIAQALEQIHALGIVHNDIKPENIIISDGNPKIIDFGLSSGGWNEQGISGSPLYMAPELFTGRKPDIKSDLYSLGLLAFVIFEGYNPFEGLSFEQLISRKKYIKLKFQKTPAETRTFIEKMLSPDPANRPASAFFLRHSLAGDGKLNQAFLPYGPSLLFDLKKEIKDRLNLLSGVERISVSVRDKKRYSRMISELSSEILTVLDLSDIQKSVNYLKAELNKEIEGSLVEGLIDLLSAGFESKCCLVYFSENIDRKLLSMLYRLQAKILILEEGGEEYTVGYLNSTEMKMYLEYVLNPSLDLGLLSDQVMSRTAGSLKKIDRELRALLEDESIFADARGWKYSPKPTIDYKLNKVEERLLGMLSVAGIPIPEELLYTLFDFESLVDAITELSRQGFLRADDGLLSAEGFSFKGNHFRELGTILAESEDFELRVRGVELLAESGDREKVIEDGEMILKNLKEKQLFWLAKRVFISFTKIDHRRLNHLKLSGLMARYTGEYRQALSFYDTALRTAQSEKNLEEESNILNDIGVIHLESGEYPLSKEYFIRSLDLSEDEKHRIRLLSNIGACNMLLREYVASEEAFRKALTIAKRENNQRFTAVLHYNLGNLLTRSNREIAIKELNKSIVISRECDLKRLLTLSFVQKAEIHMLNAEIDRARKALNSSENEEMLEVWMTRLKLLLFTGQTDAVKKTYKETLKRTSAASLNDLETLSTIIAAFQLTDFYQLERPSFLPEFKLKMGIESIKLWQERGDILISAALFYCYAQEDDIKMASNFEPGFSEGLAMLKKGLLLRDKNQPERARESLLKSRMNFAILGNEFFMSKVDVALDSLERQRTLIKNSDTLEILEMVNDIVEELDFERIIEKILSKLLNLTRGDRAILFLIDSTGRPVIEEILTREGKIPRNQIRYSQSVVRDVISTCKGLIRENVISDEDLSARDSVRNLDIRMVIASPLLWRQELLGIIYIDSKIGSKPFGHGIMSLVETLLRTASIALSNSKNYEELKKENLSLKSQRKYEDIIGSSPAIERVLRRMEIVAPEDISVLLTGETGTGKDLIARNIHKLSKRNHAPFISINCAAVPENLLESELFGYEKGAFTGASTRKLGKFEIADGGTIFLNEIGEMNPDLQAKLLSFLESRTFQRLGGLKDIKTDIRIISATNIDMEKSIAEGNFRRDLFYRLGRITISIPPLRKRREDIPDLVRHFTRQFSKELGRDIVKIDSKVMRKLMMSEWPGNIRELKNNVEELILFSQDGVIQEIPTKFETDIPLPESYKDLKIAKADIEKRSIENALNLHNWNIKQTAEGFGINRTRLHQLINKYKLR